MQVQAGRNHVSRPSVSILFMFTAVCLEEEEEEGWPVGTL